MEFQEIWVEGALTELVWYRTGTSDGLLCKLLRSVGFNKMREIYGLVKELDADGKGLCSV